MNGAESLVQALATAGVDTCFANPGTSEIHIVAALDRIPKIRSVLTLFEGVATAAADGYARMAERPCCTLLHLGPGLGNGLANLHNAKRARVPLVNIVGQHATFHLAHDTPLTSDIEGIARPFSSWVRTSNSASELSADTIDAVTAARTPPGQIATLIVPADVAWTEGGSVAHPSPSPEPLPPSTKNIEEAAAMLRSGFRTAFLLSGNALHGRGLLAAGRIASGTNSKLLSPYPLSRMERGAGIVPVERSHYILEQAFDQLKEFPQLILVGAQPPVTYFAYPGKNSVLASPTCRVHVLAQPGEDHVAALEALAHVLSLDAAEVVTSNPERPAAPTGEITLSGIASAIGATLPENAIVIDESMTSGRGLMAATKGAPPHDWLGNTGGSIGIALPLAIGAAVACPDRPVLCLTADGSAMYTLQALWTMSREALRVTTVVFSNRSYAVLKREFSYLGIGEPGPQASDMFDIGHPNLDWVLMARGMGVESCRTTSLESFTKALQHGFASHGPSLIQVDV